MTPYKTTGWLAKGFRTNDGIKAKRRIVIKAPTRLPGQLFPREINSFACALLLYLMSAASSSPLDREGRPANPLSHAQLDHRQYSLYIYPATWLLLLLNMYSRLLAPYTLPIYAWGSSLWRDYVAVCGWWRSWCRFQFNISLIVYPPKRGSTESNPLQPPMSGCLFISRAT